MFLVSRRTSTLTAAPYMPGLRITVTVASRGSLVEGLGDCVAVDPVVQEVTKPSRQIEPAIRRVFIRLIDRFLHLGLPATGPPLGGSGIWCEGVWRGAEERLRC